MSDNINLKEIWNRQEVAIPNIQNLYDNVNQLKKLNLLKLIGITITGITTIIFISFIWYFYQPKLITTKIGILLSIISIVIYVIAHNSMLSFLFKKNRAINNKDYLQLLIKLKEKQLFLQTRTLNTFFILFSLGISLYLFEFTLKMSILLGAVIYTTTLVWIAINWFYFKPLIIKKQNTKIDQLLLKFKEISNQISN